MSSRLKAFLQYIAIILVTVFLVWLSLRGVKVEEGEDKIDYLLDKWHQADKGWLFIMAFIALGSHFVRAARWKMLIGPTGYKPGLLNSFLSLMVGYFVNLFIPRGGEVSRCYNLYKLDKVPVDISFGTVVTERVVDLICLLLLVVASFVLESEKLFAFLETFPAVEEKNGSGITSILLYGLLGIIVIAGVFYFLLKKSQKVRNFIRKTWQGIKKGLLSVFQLEHKGLFVFYSVFIWFLYFLMSYAVIRAFPATEHLGFSAVMSLFGIGAIAMAAPTPGGTGSYHLLVPQGLVFLYSIARDEAVAFTFIFHGWQSVTMIVGGAISLLITSVLVKKSAGN